MGEITEEELDEGKINYPSHSTEEESSSKDVEPTARKKAETSDGR